MEENKCRLSNPKTNFISCVAEHALLGLVEDHQNYGLELLKGRQNLNKKLSNKDKQV